MAVLPPDLVRDLEPLRKQIHEQRNVVFPVIGSGLSHSLGSWDKLLDSLIERAPADAQTEMRQALAQGDYLGVAGFLESLPAIGAQTIASVIQEKFHLTGQKRRQRPEAYDLVAALPLEHFATTNYDPWLKDAVSAKIGFASRVYTPIDHGAFNDIATSSDPLVLMLHGDADRPGTCVLSEQGFRRLTHGNQAYMRGMQAIVSSRSLLFIGHSMKDPDLRSFLDEWAQIFTSDGGVPRHWILGVGLTDLQRGAFLRKGVRPISYGPAGDYSLLHDVLRHLALRPGDASPSAPGSSSPTSAGGSPPTQTSASPSSRQGPSALRPRVVLAGPWFGVPREQRESIAGMWNSEPPERKRFALARIQQRLVDDTAITQAQMALVLRHDLVLDASPWRAFARWSSVGFRTLEDTDEEQPLLKDSDTLAVFLAGASGEPPPPGFLRRMLLRAWQLPSGYRAADRLRPSLPVDGIALEGFDSAFPLGPGFEPASWFADWDSTPLGAVVFAGQRPAWLSEQLLHAQPALRLGQPLLDASEADYRRALRLVTGQVRLAGQLEDRPLEEVFVDLEIVDFNQIRTRETKRKERASSARTDRAASREEELLREEEEQIDHPQEMTRWDAGRLQEASLHLYLEGSAGSGKTTLLKWLATRFAEDPERIPIWVRLSRVAGENVVREVIHAALGAVFLPENPALLQLLTSAVDSGKASLLLDGLDEASSAIVNRIQQQLAAVCSAQNRVILSSRPVDVSRLPPGLREVRLWGLSGAGPARFLENYFDQPSWASQLLRDLWHLPDGYRWSRTPVLLSLAASLYAESRTLPESTLELYSRLIEHLFRLGACRIGLDGADAAPSVNALELLLQEALLPEVGERRIDIERARMVAIPREDLARASGLFSVSDGYRLTHLTLGEFLAGRRYARVLADQGSHLALKEKLGLHFGEDGADGNRVLALSFALALAGPTTLQNLLSLCQDDLADHRYLRLLLKAMGFSGDLVNSFSRRTGAEVLSRVVECFDLPSGIFSKYEEKTMADAQRAFLAVRKNLSEKIWEKVLPLTQARGSLGDEAVLLSWSLGGPVERRSASNRKNSDRLARMRIYLNKINGWILEGVIFSAKIIAIRALSPYFETRPQLRRLFFDENELVRMRVVEALSLDSEARPLLLTMLSDKDWNVRTAAAEALSSDSEARPLLLKMLSDKDGNVRSSVAEALSSAPEARPHLLKMLSDKDENVRAASVKALSSAPEARPHLLKMLSDKDRNVRSIVAVALSSAPEARPHLLKMLSDKDGRVRVAAVEALSSDPEARPQLLKMLSDKDKNVRSSVAKALSSAPEARPHLLKMLSDKDGSVRAAAVKALAPAPEAHSQLLRMLSDEDENVRAASVKALSSAPEARSQILEMLSDKDGNVRSIVAIALSSDPEARPHLLKMLSDEDGNVRRNAVIALASAPEAHSQLLKILSDKDWNVRAAAAKALAPAPEAHSQLLQMLSDEDGNVRAATVKALALEPEARSQILEMLSDKDGNVRAVAVEALSSDPEARPQLLKMLSDKNGRVRRSVTRALSSTPEAYPHLLKMLSDGDGLVRRSAVRALSSVPEAHPHLLKMLSDKDGSVRAAAVSALSSVPEAHPRLLKMLSDEDEYVRIIAANALSSNSEARSQILKMLSDKNELARMSAVVALSSDSKFRPQILEMLSDENEYVRMIAAEAFSSDPEVRPLLLAMLSDNNESVRAAAVSALSSDPQVRPQFRQLLSDSSQNVRAAAAKALSSDPEARSQFRQLLFDENESVREVALAVLREDFRSHASSGFLRSMKGAGELAKMVVDGELSSGVPLERKFVLERFQAFLVNPTQAIASQEPGLFELLQDWILLRLGASSFEGKISPDRLYGVVTKGEVSLLHIWMTEDRLPRERWIYPNHNLIEAWRVARHMISPGRHAFWLACADIPAEHLTPPELAPGEVRYGSVFYGFRLHTPETAPKKTSSPLPLVLALLTRTGAREVWQAASPEDRAAAEGLLASLVDLPDLEPWSLVPMLAHAREVLPPAMVVRLLQRMPRGATSGASLLDRIRGGSRVLGEVSKPTSTPESSKELSTTLADQEVVGQVASLEAASVAGLARLQDAFEKAKEALDIRPVDAARVLASLEACSPLLSGASEEDLVHLINLAAKLWFRVRTKEVATRLATLLGPIESMHTSSSVQFSLREILLVVRRF